MSLLRLLLGNRRSAERIALGRTVRLFADDRHLADVVVVEASETGARLQAPDALSLPKEFVLLDFATAHAHKVRMVWRGGGAAGVRFLKSQRLRGFVPAEFQLAKEHWTEVAAYQGGHAAPPPRG